MVKLHSGQSNPTKNNVNCDEKWIHPFDPKTELPLVKFKTSCRTGKQREAFISGKEGMVQLYPCRTDRLVTAGGHHAHPGPYV